MTNFDDLPHSYQNGKWVPFREWDEKTMEVLGPMTAHTKMNTYRSRCNRCGKVPGLVVRKPESPAVWCLDCF